jgi:diguanylate cyclase (GGDEF)-like protein
MNEKNYLDNFKYSVTKISLLLAIIISFSFLLLRIINFMPEILIATINTSVLTFFLLSMYICLIKCKEKLYAIQLITYVILVTFIIIQTTIEKSNIFLPIWLNFTIMTAFIVTDKKTALLISSYSLLGIVFIKLQNYYLINEYSFVTLIMSIFAFTILGLLVAIQLEKYNNKVIEQSKKLEELALIDELTQIFNRRAFYKISRKIISHAKRENKQIAIIMFDLDHFKRVNDTYGHKVGDIVLKHFVDTIKSCIRDNDLFARIGGEEFAMLIYDITKNDLDKLIAKILQEIRALNIKIDKKREIKITASLGAYIFDPNKDDDIQHALIYADKALYKAKHSGRNKVEYYSSNS